MASNKEKLPELDDLDDLDESEQEELDDFGEDTPPEEDNSREKELVITAAALLALSLKQEKKITKELEEHFKKLSGDVKKHYSKYSKLPKFDGHRDVVKDILKDHYIETAGFASRMFRDEFEDVSVDDQEIIHEIINRRIEKESEDHSDESADLISETTEKNYKEYIKEAIAVAAAAGILLSARDIAEYISEKFEETAEGRIDTISTTETGIAISDGQLDEIQALEDVKADFEGGTNITEYTRTKTWVAILDERTRPWHEEADGQTVPIDQPFIVHGEELMMPRDDSLGASPDNIINCLHPDTIVQDAIPTNLTRRRYKGKLFTIQTACGNEVSVTSNHPILKADNWTFAHLLKEGDSIVCRRNGQRMGLANLDVQNREATIEQIFNSFSKPDVVMRMRSGTVNFHGENIIDNNVDIINSDRVLLKTKETSFSHPIEKLFLPHADILPAFFSEKGSLDSSFERLTKFAQSNMGLFSEALSFFWRSLGHSKIHAFGSVPLFDPFFVHSINDNSSAAIQLFSDRLYGKSFIKQFHDFFNSYGMFVVKGGLSGKITSFLDRFFVDRIVHIDVKDYDGYVYNLQDISGYYNGNGIVLHNCRCEAVFAMEPI